MKTVKALVVLLLSLGVLRAAEGPPKLDYEPTSHYERRKVEGWQVFVNHDLLNEQKKLGGQARRLLRAKLYDIRRAVPAVALEKL